MKYSSFFVAKWYFNLPLAMIAIANIKGNPVGTAAAICALLMLTPWFYNSYAPYLPKMPAWVVPAILLFAVFILATSTPEFKQMQRTRFVQDSIRAAKRAQREQEKSAERAKETRATKTIDPYEKHFSGWDGSCTPLVKHLKSAMNDPKSFEHVETLRALPDNGHVRVKMRFRCKNGFGALVLQTVTCELWADGTLTGVEVE